MLGKWQGSSGSKDGKVTVADVPNFSKHLGWSTCHLAVSAHPRLNFVRYT